MKPTKNLMRNMLVLICFLASTFAFAQGSSTQEILEEFVESYKSDPMALSTTFGIKVGEEWWSVKVERTEEPYLVGKNKQYTFHNIGPHQVTLMEGEPSSPTWYFRFADKSVLDKIKNQEWTATTAAAKSTPADITALDLLDMDGYQSSQGSSAIAYQTLEHFWKTNAGEVTRFSRDSALPSHGAQIVGLYTMKDKRISWFTLGTDEVANGDRGLEKGQVPNLFIITKGKGKAQIGEEEIELEAGMSVFVGPYVNHVLYNPYEEPLEGILILYGDNIDYALGQSYLDFLEKEYAFYEENERTTRKVELEK